jgi:lipoprotein NlpD
MTSMKTVRFIIIFQMLFLAACSNNWKAPVESRSGGPPGNRAEVYSPRQQTPVNTVPEAEIPVTETSPPVDAGNARRVYRVRPGDTLYSISRSQGIAVVDLVAWNSLPPPYTISPGQSLKLYSSGENREIAASTSQDSRYSDEKKPATAVNQDTVTGKTEAPEQPAVNKKTRQVDGLDWQWPVEGKITQTFSPSDPARRGIKIAGKTGTQITAAGDGEVVYSGDGLVGYGQLVIIKHNRQFLSAYGHNQKRFVKEGDKVKRGAVIATMGEFKGKSLLHFEIRRSGKPVNPKNYLP